MRAYMRGVSLYAIAASGALLAIPTTTLAQGAASAQPAQVSPSDEAGEPAQGGDIIVTAQKREERLLDVPLSVRAITGAEIESRGVQSVLDLQNSVPGLVIVERGPGQEQAQLRGISASSGLPTVGLYLDEVSINSETGYAGLDVRLLDLERVEVLRGPQATLYGEGSMGGTIRYITASPDLNDFSGRVEGEIGTVKDGGTTYRGLGVVNLPVVTDTLGVRLVAGYERLGGWIDAPNTGVKDANDIGILTLRGKLLFQPTDSLTISLLGVHQEQNQDYKNEGLRNRTTASHLPTRNDDDYDLGNLVVSYDLGPATLLSSTGYLNRRSKGDFDLTDALLPFLGFFGVPPGTVTAIGFPNKTDFETWSEELRLTSNGTGPLKYAIGANYRHSKTDATSGATTFPVTLPFTLFSFINKDTTKSWAAFGEVGYELTDGLDVLVGARYFRDTRSQNRNSVQFGAPSIDINRKTFTTFNPRVNLSYKTSPNGLIYFNAAKGFRSGGFNLTSTGLGMFTIPPTFDPENLWSYELGTKQQWLDRRLTVEAAIYFNDWKNIQTSVVVPGNPVTFTTNGGKASGFGFDLSLTARPSNRLSVTMTLGHTDMKYKTNTLDRFKGDPLDFVAPWTYSAALDYRVPVGTETALIAHVDSQHTSGFQLTLRNFPVKPVAESDARDIVNARIGADFGRFEAYLFAENLFDDNGVLFPPVATQTENVLARPRTLGVELKARF